MLRSRLPALLLATLPALGADTATAADGDGRYPIWPSEIDRVAGPLRDPTTMSEGARIAALSELGEYASEVILPDLELALTDPSPEVRKTALQMCASRQLPVCMDEAEAMWEDGEGGVRLMALELLSREPTPEHLELIYEAMRDPNDLVREHAITLLVQAPLDEEGLAAARKELVAQLGDISARVRRTAASSLGQLGPGEGALALVRLLEDMDRTVANAAAISLGRLADPRTGPSLRRALEAPYDANFGAAVVTSIAQLPGESVDEVLLELFDTPPRNLRRADVAKAMGGRPQPGPALIAGLVARMRDPDLRPSATNALLWLGDRAVAQLEAATKRGLEPDIALEVERLLAARRIELTPRVASQAVVEVAPVELPALDAREQWFELLGDPEAAEAGAALAELGPKWFEGALAWQLDRASTATQVRPWLTALALHTKPILGEAEHDIIWTKIAAWAHDAGASSDARCTATIALGRAVDTRHADMVRAELQSLTAAHLPDVRGCAALGLARYGGDPVFELLLADPSARVRATTALAVGMIRKPSIEIRSRLALQSDHDSETRARTSAAWAASQRGKSSGLALLRGPTGTSSGSTVISHWKRFVIEGREVDVPMLGSGRGWALVPLEGASPAAVEPSPLAAEPYRYDYYEYYH